MSRIEINPSEYVKHSAGKKELCKCNPCKAAKTYFRNFLCEAFWEVHPFSSESLIRFRRRIAHAHSPNVDYLKVEYHQPGSPAHDCLITNVRTNVYFTYTFFSDAKDTGSLRTRVKCEMCCGFLDCTQCGGVGGGSVTTPMSTESKAQEHNSNVYTIGVRWAPLIEHVRFLTHIETFILQAKNKKNIGSLINSCNVSRKSIEEFLHAANR